MYTFFAHFYIYFYFQLYYFKTFFIFLPKKRGNVYFFSTPLINPRKFRYTFRYTLII